MKESISKVWCIFFVKFNDLLGLKQKGKLKMKNQMFLTILAMVLAMVLGTTRASGYDVNEFEIVGTDDVEGWNDVAGNFAVWIVKENGITWNVHGKYLPDGDIIDIRTLAGVNSLYPSTDGRTVVWHETDPNGPNVWGYDIGTGVTFLIDGSNGEQFFADVYGNKCVYTDDIGEGRNIYCTDFTDPNNPVKFPVCTSNGTQYGPKIWKDKVIWEDHRNEVERDVYGADISDPCNIVEFEVIANDGYDQYFYSGDFSNNMAVFHEDPVLASIPHDVTDLDVYAIDLSDPNTKIEICKRDGFQADPDISGDLVTWTDDYYGNLDIYCCDLFTGEIFPVCTATGEQYRPTIGGNAIIWMDKRNGNEDVYGAYITPDSDFNSDYRVDFKDYAIFALQWDANDCSDPNWCGGVNLDQDGNVDFNDLRIFVHYWLWPNSEDQGGEMMGMGGSSSQQMRQPLDMQPVQQVQPVEVQPVKEIDIDEMVRLLSEIWLQDDGIREVISEDRWNEFIDKVKNP